MKAGKTGRTWAYLTIIWILLVAAFTAYYAIDIRQEPLKLAEVEAMASYHKDLVYRSWSSGHGGVYVEESEQTPANPYLSHIPERDIVTPSGRRLTLVNPAYMTRQVHELSSGQYGTSGHITSLNLLNPNNAPDEWEKRALREFEKGAARMIEALEVEGQEIVRVMFPLYVEPDCLKCHAAQGYEVGEVRGGLSVTVPTAPYRRIYDKEVRDLAYLMGSVFLLGLVGLYFGRRQATRHVAALARVNENVLRNERKYRRLIDEAPYGIAVADRETGVVLEANTALLEMTGYEREELIGMRQKDLHPGVAGDDDVSASFARHRGDDDGRILRAEILTREGRRKPVEIKAHAVELDGQVVMQGFFNDISQREEARADAQRRERQMSAIFEAARNVAFVIADSSPQARVIEFSPGAEAIFGYKREEIIGQPVRLLHAERDADEIVEMQHQMQDGQIGFQGETRLMRKSGEEFTGLFTLYPMLDENGRRYGGLGVTVDITERKWLEEQLRQSQKMEAIGTLAGGIAHDFNNILGAILGFTELTVDRLPPDSEEYDNLQQSLSAVNRAKELVKQILMFSRRAEEVRRPLAVHVVLKEIVKLLRQTIPTTIGIELDIADEECRVLADPTQMHQVLMNLCTNAYHAMKESGGELGISLAVVRADDDLVEKTPELVPGEYARISVTDTGTGIEPDALPRIFDPFFTTKPTGEGTGMGLSVVHGIVRSHGGAIGVDSRPAAGTRVDVYLPLVEAATDDGEDLQKPLRQGSERILFVDDEPMLVDLGRRSLESLGYQVSSFTNSREALAALEADPAAFDLLMTDQTMPGLTGDVLAARALALRPGLPVIICTGYSDLLNDADAQAMGVRAVLMKPIDRTKLSLTLRRIFDRP